MQIYNSQFFSQLTCFISTLYLSLLAPSSGFLQRLSQVEVKGQAKAQGGSSETMEMMTSISDQGQQSPTSPTPERRDWTGINTLYY